MKVKKPAWAKFKLKKPRKETEVVFQCFADSRMFVRNFEDMPKGMQLIFKEISLPCDAGGVPGEWCSNTPELFRSITVLAERFYTTSKSIDGIVNKQ